MTYTLPAIGAPAARPPLPKVAVEEHFNVLAAGPGSAQQIDLSRLVASMGYDRTWMSLVDARLVEFDERVAAMDAAGVDVSVLSHTVPGAQGIVDPALAAAAARDINDVLAGAIARHPTRFAGLAVRNSCRETNLFKLAATFVEKQEIRHGVVGNEEIHEAIVVYVSCHRTKRLARRTRDA